MASKIVKTKSDPLKGEINILDLQKIIQDFENFAELKSTSAREFYKIPRVTMRVELLQALLNKAKEEDYVSIRFGITLPEQTSCKDFTTDISNQLTVAIMLGHKIARENATIFVEYDQPNDLVITAGFRPNSVNVTGDLCCGDPNGGS